MENIKLALELVIKMMVMCFWPVLIVLLIVILLLIADAFLNVFSAGRQTPVKRGPNRL